MSDKEFKRNSYVNYSKAASQVAKPEPDEDVAVNATETAQPVNHDTESRPEKGTHKYVNVASLNVRATPDASTNNIVRCIARDTVVNVIEEVGDFSKIGPNEYVMTKFLI